MKLICPECKNDVDLSKVPTIADGNIVECNMCGITLQVMQIREGVVMATVVDEGK